MNTAQRITARVVQSLAAVALAVGSVALIPALILQAVAHLIVGEWREAGRLRIDVTMEPTAAPKPGE